MLPPFSCPMGAEAPRAAEQTAINLAAVSHGQHVPTPTAAAAWRATRRWVKRPGDLDLWPFDLESGVRVTYDVGYLCANFGLSRPVCSRLRPDVRDRQTDRRQTASSLNAPPIRGGGIINGTVVDSIWGPTLIWLTARGHAHIGWALRPTGLIN